MGSLSGRDGVVPVRSIFVVCAGIALSTRSVRTLSMLGTISVIIREDSSLKGASFRRDSVSVFPPETFGSTEAMLASNAWIGDWFTGAGNVPEMLKPTSAKTTTAALAVAICMERSNLVTP